MDNSYEAVQQAVKTADQHRKTHMQMVIENFETSISKTRSLRHAKMEKLEAAKKALFAAEEEVNALRARIADLDKACKALEAGLLAARGME